MKKKSFLLLTGALMIVAFICYLSGYHTTIVIRLTLSLLIGLIAGLIANFFTSVSVVDLVEHDNPLKIGKMLLVGIIVGAIMALINYGFYHQESFVLFIGSVIGTLISCSYKQEDDDEEKGGNI
ncbi:MAG: hypothetical protein WCK37_01635 [Candidatus Falkowbacteria bacterium]